MLSKSDGRTREFDSVASTYDAEHRDNLAISGEDPRYFADYKAQRLLEIVGRDPGPVLDFGCAIGNLTASLAEKFDDVAGFDVSSGCIDVARKRLPGQRFYSELELVPRGHFGTVVVANVLHHVNPHERARVLAEAAERLRAGGTLVVFEHNPFNPLTLHVVKTCPFDEGVILLSPAETRDLFRGAGFRRPKQRYIVFFPKSLAPFRSLEPHLGWLPAGAQVCTWAKKDER